MNFIKKKKYCITIKMNWIVDWKKHIEDLENGGRRNLDERRCFNRFLSGGSDNEHYLFLVQAMEGGGWFPNWMNYINIFKASESITIMNKLKKNMKVFCNAMEKNKLFPRKKFFRLLKISDELCKNKDMKMLHDHPEQTGMVIEALRVKSKESKVSYMRRVIKWAWENKWTIFTLSTILFLGYILWCYFTAGTGCWLATSIFSKLGISNVVKEKVLKLGVQTGKNIISKPLGKHGFVVLENIGKATHPVLKYAKKGVEGSIDLRQILRSGGIACNINNFFLNVLHNFLVNHEEKYEKTNAWYQYVCENYDINAENTFCDNEHLKLFANVLFKVKK